jgi:hypothetical protein
MVENIFVIRRGWDKGPSLEPLVAPETSCLQSRALVLCAAWGWSDAVREIAFLRMDLSDQVK